MVYFNFIKMAKGFGKSLDWVESVCRHFFESNFENFYTETFIADLDYFLFPPDEGSGVKSFVLIIRDTNACPVYLIRVGISNSYDSDGLLPFDPVWHADFFSYSFTSDKKSLSLEFIDRCSFSESDFINDDLENYDHTGFYVFL